MKERFLKVTSDAVAAVNLSREWAESKPYE